jgi:hypothetical protein
MHICIDSTYIVFAIRKSFHSESLSICTLRVKLVTTVPTKARRMFRFGGIHVLTRTLDC